MRCRMTQALVHSAACGRNLSAKMSPADNKAAWRYITAAGVPRRALWALPAQDWNRPCSAATGICPDIVHFINCNT